MPVVVSNLQKGHYPVVSIVTSDLLIVVIRSGERDSNAKRFPGPPSELHWTSTTLCLSRYRLS